MSRLLLNVIASFAGFERKLMLERQRDGITKAKAEGRYKGRVPTARRQADEARRLLAQGLGKSEVAQRLGIARQSLYNILADPDRV